jgi:hypothetical protein
MQTQLLMQHSGLKAAALRLSEAEEEAWLLQEQLRQQVLDAAEAAGVWQRREHQLMQQLQDALSEKAALASSLEAEAQARAQQWVQAQHWQLAAEAQLSQAGQQIARLRGQLDGAAVTTPGSMVQRSRAAAARAAAWPPPPPPYPPPLPSSGQPPPPPPYPPPPPATTPVQQQLHSPQSGAGPSGEGQPEADDVTQAAPAPAAAAEAAAPTAAAAATETAANSEAAAPSEAAPPAEAARRAAAAAAARSEAAAAAPEGAAAPRGGLPTQRSDVPRCARRLRPLCLGRGQLDASGEYDTPGTDMWQFMRSNTCVWESIFQNFPSCSIRVHCVAFQQRSLCSGTKSCKANQSQQEQCRTPQSGPQKRPAQLWNG